ncbi:MAG: DNA double-strand break repair nuclease NurA [Chloroflexota bacterium]|nr:DNA double-strand break repair nuclease NurA [Chloroflexota bacterium]
MPFDASEVARQIEVSRSGVRSEETTRAEAVELALRIYGAVDETQWEQRVQDATARRWVGSPSTPLRRHPKHVPARPNYCVVASDSSFIPPDKHRGAYCHLINVGRVMVRYGELRAAEIDNTPTHYAEMPVESEENSSGKILAAKCALRELEELYNWARSHGADAALVDGSLMQLVNVLSKEKSVQSLMSEYFQILDAFRALRVPVIGYISQPASQMVIRAIRMLACEQTTPCERRPDEPCSCTPLWSIDDSDIFYELLDEGELSPLFEPLFSYLVGDNAAHVKNMLFAYLGTEYEVARLEFPSWLAEEGLLESAVATILHQCKLGGGYPNALTLAHQYAVLHNQDRTAYHFMLERAGLMKKTTEKAHGKRLIGQSI